MGEDDATATVPDPEMQQFPTCPFVRGDDVFRSDEIEQMVLNLTQYDCGYLNFFFTPGSHNSLKRLVDDGWRLILCKELGERNACVLLERKRSMSIQKTGDSDG